MQSLITKVGYDYAFNPDACKECGGKCCTGEQGYIWVNQEEIKKISEFIKVDFDTFVLDYLKKIKYKYSIKDVLVNGSYECLFFDKEKGCSIYEVRPSQCISYPFWDYVKENLQREKENCPGII